MPPWHEGAKLHQKKFFKNYFFMALSVFASLWQKEVFRISSLIKLLTSSSYHLFYIKDGAELVKLSEGAEVQL